MKALIGMAVAEEPVSFEDYICDDGMGYGPYKIKCTMWREDGRVVLDSCLGNALAHFVHNMLFWIGGPELLSWAQIAAVRAEVEHALSCAAVGSPATVRRQMETLLDRYAPDEVMLTGMIHDHAARLRSFELAMQAWHARHALLGRSPPRRPLAPSQTPWNVRRWSTQGVTRSVPAWGAPCGSEGKATPRTARKPTTSGIVRWVPAGRFSVTIPAAVPSDPR